MFANHRNYQDYLAGRMPIIPEVEFVFWANKASVIINKATLDKLKEESIAIPDEVIIACCALAEAIYEIESPTAEKVLTTEKVGNWSGTYKTNNLSLQDRQNEILKTYLDNTGLLFRGNCQ